MAINCKKIKVLWTQLKPHNFDVSAIRSNIHLLEAVKKDERFISDHRGRLRVTTPRTFFLSNFIRAGALTARNRQAIYYTVIGFLFDLRSPLEKEKLFKIAREKSKRFEQLIERLEDKKLKKKLQSELSAYRQRSWIQWQVIRLAFIATNKAYESPRIVQVKQALKKGVLPTLTLQGYSGTYIMRGTNYQPLGIFKPFDEEIMGPNNPSGDKYRGPLGVRQVRSGIRVGECMHREVAASIVDKFLDLNIVPHTVYATFTDSSFGGIQAFFSPKFKEKKVKRGSFQEFKENAHQFHKFGNDAAKKLSVHQVQTLFILDFIIGNSDRHLSNLLYDGKAIVAIDNGLSFSDRVEEYGNCFWHNLPQLKEVFLPEFKEKIISLDIEKLSNRLKKRANLSYIALKRMEARIVLLKQFCKQSPQDIIESYLP